MKVVLFLIMLGFASEKKDERVESVVTFGERPEEKNAENLILVKIEEDEYVKANKGKSSNYIGVHLNYVEKTSRWQVSRWSKNEKKPVHNGTHKDEEKAAHASDTLARKLMANGEQGHKLNFPNDDTEVYPEEKETSSNYIGVTYYKNSSRWVVKRWSKNGSKYVYNGYYNDEEKAAHASDTLARNLMTNGEQSQKFNFPDDDTDVYPEQKKSSKYIGVSYNKNESKWVAYRQSKKEKKPVRNGYYKDEETAAHVSDTVARKLMTNGEQGHRLNFPDDGTAMYPEYQRNKRKRSDQKDLKYSQKNQY